MMYREEIHPFTIAFMIISSLLAAIAICETDDALMRHEEQEIRRADCKSDKQIIEIIGDSK